MPATRLNPRLVKLHRSYKVDEIAALFNVHRNTVRSWLARGLQAVDDRRPILVLGRHLATFLQNRRDAAKRPCGPGEIYCLRCREPRRPAHGAVRYLPTTPTQGSLVGRCGCCGAGLNRRVSITKLPQVVADLVVTMEQLQGHIDESPQPSLNSHFKQDGRNHANSPP